MAHSISDIPALLDEVEALQRELEDLHSGRTIPRIAQEQVSADAKARRAEYKAKYVKEETK